MSDETEPGGEAESGEGTADEAGTEIRRLDDDTVARIAAGEVVERPASAVKELVENALDAGASRLSVAVSEGGTESIRVSDDGRGMTEADVRAAVREHTTSKIGDVTDLDSGVSTLGFRGEALHTIGSVSRLRIETKARGTEGAGTELVSEGGEVRSVEPTGCPEGTAVTVEDLFFNTPARRKFLKATATEFAHVNRVVTRYALANPDVAVSLTHDGREVFSTTGQGDLQAAVLSVYGREVASAMIPVESEGEELPAGPLESVSGLVSHPETNRSSREYLATYVNGRAVTSPAIREGIMGAYEGQLGDRYPFVVLFLSVPGDAVDVNVHPRKREVRFDDDDAVRRSVDSAVEAALLDHGLLRSTAPRGRSAPEQTSVSPSSSRPDSDREPGSAQTEGADDAEVAESARAGTARKGHRARDSGTDSAGDAATAAATDAASADETDAGEAPQDPVSTRSPPDRTSAPPDEDAPPAPSGSEPADASSDPGPSPARAFEAGEQRTLGGEAASTDREFDSLPSLRVLGQLEDTYLVCEGEDGLVLIDQHAADERVHYERLREEFADDPAAQTLASPVELEVTAAEAEAFSGYREALSRLGFHADRTGDHTVSVTTVPAVVGEVMAPEGLRNVLDSVVAGDREAGAETVDALADDFLADLACHPAIKGNTSLREGSVVDLLSALDDCTNPYACPHGRPVIISIDGDEIGERFERDYPGHA
ncbi:DNA mismatch repair endonuclease MutL [Saliphagus sp. LR7]|uniref:DNA mismatch repair endonuclease MutL n=1 Tax=Saliphagus sp. LR7 TaxID=2282654 RepID=UPI000DF7AC29|nr:DNA mismatch repair endonuclease MutL [Saliphagus sp. LR7]